MLALTFKQRTEQAFFSGTEKNEEEKRGEKHTCTQTRKRYFRYSIKNKKKLYNFFKTFFCFIDTQKQLTSIIFFVLRLQRGIFFKRMKNTHTQFQKHTHEK